MSSGPFKNIIYKMCLEIIYLIYMYKKNLALDNLQSLICHKTKVCFGLLGLWHIKLCRLFKAKSIFM